MKKRILSLVLSVSMLGVMFTASGCGSDVAGENGKLYGTVTAADVADALKAQFDLDVDKKKIVIPEDIKTLGEYTVQVKLLASAVAEIRMSVVADA